MSGTIEEEILYDVFISYHERDTEWVVKSMITYLENEGIRVCWDSRDFEPGKTVTENKLNAICLSATTVVILTPDYTKDEIIWMEMNDQCGWDNDEIIKEFCLIPVVLKTCHIPDIFKPLWKLNWTNLATRKFFWTKIVQCIKKQRNSYACVVNNQLPSKKIDFAKKLDFAKKRAKQTPTANSNKVITPFVETSHYESEKQAKSEVPSGTKEFKVKNDFRNLEKQDSDISSKTASLELNKFAGRLENEEVIKEKMSDLASGIISSTPAMKSENRCETRWQKTENSLVLVDKLEDTVKADEKKSAQSSDTGVENERCLSSGSGIAVNTKSSHDIGSDVDYDDANHSRKIMECMSPRILSFFVPEDDDLSRKDVEELTFKIEDVFAEEAKLLYENSTKCSKSGVYQEATKRTTSNISCKNKEVFSSPQEQMRYLDSLQEKEVKIKCKFQNCCDCGRKRIYRRLLERFDKAIFSTVNGEKNTELLVSLPISDLSCDETGEYCCPCCERLFHSERALDMHTGQCVRQTWIEILKG